MSIVWKRGPETQQTEWYDLNEYTNDSEIGEKMQKVSTFYSKDSKENWEPKLCTILLNVKHNKIQTNFEYEMNMSDYINQTDAAQTIEYQHDFEKFRQIKLDVKWTI